MKNKIIFKTLMLKGEAGSTIVSMEKTGHVGTADIYTITFNDGSTTEISLENMSAITSVEKTSSTDTEDIYTITCADGSTQTFSVLNHNADIAAMSDDIDTIDARVDNFINSVVPNTVETLWTGSIQEVGDSATLSKAVSNFDYIDLYLLGSADSKYIRVPSSQTSVSIQQQNLSDDASSNFLRLWEMGVSISGTTVSITKSIAWAWDDPDNSNPTVTANAQNGVPITRIDGVKIASASPAELTDIRVGSNNETYSTAGDAVRSQIKDVEENISKVLDNNFLYDNNVTLTGTTYVSQKIYESVVSDLSVKWTLEIENVVGANAPFYGLVRYFDENDTQIAQTGTTTTLPIKLTVTPPTDTVKIAFVLYASTTPALPSGSATFYGVKIYQGTERIYSINESINYERLDEDETRISDLETDISQYDDLLTQSRNIATSFVDARINVDTGAVYQPAGITGYGATVTAMEVDPSTQYTITLDFTIKYSNIVIFAYGANDNYIGRVTPDRSVLSNSDKNNIVVFTTDANTHFVRINIYTSLQAFSEDHILVFQLEKGGVPSMPVNQTIVNNNLIDAETQYKRLVENGVIVNDFVVPSYFDNDNYLNTKIARINELCESCAANGDAFIFITDEHMTAGQNRATKPNQGHSYSLIKRISDNCRIPRLFDGGDNADAGSIEHTLNLRKAFNGKIYHVTGNHDTFYETSKDTLYYYMDMYNDDQVGNNANRYFYVDNKAKKIRYIVLASSEGDAATENENNGIFGTDTDQLTWLTNTALNVESGWDIIIFIHMMFYVNPTAARDLNRFGTALETALDSYSGNGKILAVIQGHTHVDRIAYTTGGIPVIMTTCDKNIPANIGDVDDLTFERPTGTIAEQAFDVVILDRDSKTFHFVRIGAPAQDGVGDNTGNFVQERTVSYT